MLYKKKIYKIQLIFFFIHEKKNYFFGFYLSIFFCPFMLLASLIKHRFIRITQHNNMMINKKIDIFFLFLYLSFAVSSLYIIIFFFIMNEWLMVVHEQLHREYQWYLPGSNNNNC